MIVSLAAPSGLRLWWYRLRGARWVTVHGVRLLIRGDIEISAARRVGIRVAGDVLWAPPEHSYDARHISPTGGATH